MGIANGLIYILEAAKLLSDSNQDDIDFIFLGEGKAKKQCLAFVEKHSLTNIIFMDRVAMDMTSEIVNLCDVSIVPFLNLPILTTNSPNKLFDSLSSAKPAIVNSNGWTREIVEKYSCGAYVDPEKPQDLASLLIEWKKQPALLKNMGANGRKLAEEKYDKSILTKQFVEVINKYGLKTNAN